MPENFLVKNELGLNIRTEPVVKPSTRIATLPFRQRVTKLQDSDVPKWWKVSTSLDGTEIQGFVNSTFLSKASDVPNPPPATSVKEVHLSTSNPVRRNGKSRAFPLNEAGQPTRDPAGSAASKAQSLTDIVKWLKVDVSVRYQRTPGSTFCNIYAYDYCSLAKVYLPRVWWNDRALIDLANGRTVRPIYDGTVHEMNANALFEWFHDFGSTFGWRRETSLTALQTAANDGNVVIITAEHKDPHRSGHICAVVPETSTKKAVRASTGAVTKPLQSQAGASNFQYGTDIWWTKSTLKSFAFYIHD